MPALALAAEAVKCADWDEPDDEFGLAWSDFPDAEWELDVRWVLYRSVGVGVLLRVAEAKPVPLSVALERTVAR